MLTEDNEIKSLSKSLEESDRESIGVVVHDSRESLVRAIDEMAAQSVRHRVGEMLVASGAITQRDLDMALDEQRSGRGLPLGTVLIKMGKITVSQLESVLSQKRYLRVDLDRLKPEPEALALVSLHLCHRLTVLPLLMHSGRLIVAMENPSRRGDIEAVALASGARVFPVAASGRNIATALFAMPLGTQTWGVGRTAERSARPKDPVRPEATNEATTEAAIEQRTAAALQRSERGAATAAAPVASRLNASVKAPAPAPSAPASPKAAHKNGPPAHDIPGVEVVEERLARSSRSGALGVSRDQILAAEHGIAASRTRLVQLAMAAAEHGASTIHVKVPGRSALWASVVYRRADGQPMSQETMELVESQELLAAVAAAGSSLANSPTGQLSWTVRLTLPTRGMVSIEPEVTLLASLTQTSFGGWHLKIEAEPAKPVFALAGIPWSATSGSLVSRAVRQSGGVLIIASPQRARPTADRIAQSLLLAVAGDHKTAFCFGGRVTPESPWQHIECEGSSRGPRHERVIQAVAAACSAGADGLLVAERFAIDEEDLQRVIASVELADAVHGGLQVIFAVVARGPEHTANRLTALFSGAHFDLPALCVYQESMADQPGERVDVAPLSLDLQMRLCRQYFELSDLFDPEPNLLDRLIDESDCPPGEVMVRMTPETLRATLIPAAMPSVDRKAALAKVPREFIGMVEQAVEIRPEPRICQASLGAELSEATFRRQAIRRILARGLTVSAYERRFGILR